MRRIVVAPVAALVLAHAAAAPPPAAVAASEFRVPGLGTATPLELLATTGDRLVTVAPRSDVAGHDPVGWGVDADVPGTVDLLPFGAHSRAWPGAPGGPGEVTAGDGWVHRRWGRAELLAVRSPDGSPDPTVVESNLDAGGATWTWTHRGVQYVNDHDHGRQVQASLFVDTPWRVFNPNEAGDQWSNVGMDPELRHGSPLAWAVTEGATQTTGAVPLDWRPVTGEWNAVVFRDVRLGKELTLDWQGAPGVSRYRTVVEVPERTRGHLEMPTAYLRAAFSRLVGIDAGTGAWTDLRPAAGDTRGLDYRPPSGRGGVVASTPDGRHAFGIYGATEVAGGEVRTFTVHSFLPPPPTLLQPAQPVGTGQFDAHTVKLRALRDHSDFPAGRSSYDAFVVTGTLHEVAARMAWLAAGADAGG